MQDSHVRDSALVNTLENFSYVFNNKIKGLFIDRMDQNEKLADKFFNDDEFNKVVSEYLMKQVYDDIRDSLN
jgi:type I restriction enzyme R subunit